MFDDLIYYFIEVSYVVLTRSRPVITQLPPKVFIGKLDEIAALSTKPADTQSEFYGRLVQRGAVLNNGREMKVQSSLNPDWRLIRKDDEDYYLKNTTETLETSDENLEQKNANLLQEHIHDIIKFWTRTNG